MKTNSKSKEINFLKGGKMMRKLVLFVFALFIVTALSVKTVSAVPTLQLDIVGGEYDWSTETIVNGIDGGSTFTLLALLNTNIAVEDLDLFYVSIAISPQLTEEEGADIGSFVFDGNTINATSDMTYGSPPIDAIDSKNLQSHGIYDTYYYEYAFSFDGDTTSCYNTKPGGEENCKGDLYVASFVVNWSGLIDSYGLHFDLYNTDFKTGKHWSDPELYVKDFAPFSHDAATTPVPEPGTLLLLGSGLVGMGLFGRRRREK